MVGLGIRWKKPSPRKLSNLCGNVANGIETRHVEGNEDEVVHEAINSDLIERGTIDTKHLINLDDMLCGVTVNIYGDEIEEVETQDTPTHNITSGLVKHDEEFLKN